MRDRLVDRPSSAGIRRFCSAVTGPLMDPALLFVAPQMFDDQEPESVRPARVQRWMNFVTVGHGAYYARMMISIDPSTCAKDRPCLMQLAGEHTPISRRAFAVGGIVRSGTGRDSPDLP
jgi:hypothetical protein